MLGVTQWFYKSGFCIPQTAGWQPSLHYPTNHTPGLSSLSQNSERDLWVFQQTSGSDPQQLPAPQLWQGQEGDLTHRTWETGTQFTSPETPGCLFSRLWDTQMRNRDCGGPTPPPWFRKGSFSGNLSCRFPSTGDLRAALLELSNAGDRCRTVTAHFSKACNFPGAAGQADTPLPSCQCPVSIAPLPTFSSSDPIPFFSVLFSLQVCSPFPKHNWLIHFTTVLTSL